MTASTVELEALRLSADERAKLAHKLPLGLDTPSALENEQSWLDEAQRRARDLDQGRVQPVPAEEVRRKAQALQR
ncbi:MAG: addiction module protein [Salinisphaera sp.]|nr:addiction module protein [Salinisphaera sp.]MDN5937752.1 addiction module protein [Salinisphaera sp.]